MIGAGMGGLCAAIHARLRGWDVLVLEQSLQVGGKAAGIQIGEFALDPGPSIIILPRFYEDLFRDAGRSMDDYLRFRRLPVLSRVFMEGQAPLDLPADEAECLRVLDDLSPSDGRAMRTLLDRIAKVEPLLAKTVYDHPYTSPLQLADLRLMKFGMSFNPMRKYRELVDELFQLPLMRAFFYGFPSYGGQTYDAKSPGAFLIPYYMLRDGLFFPEGGVRAIPRAFARLAAELGVEFRLGAAVAGVTGDGSRMRSVRLSDGEVVEADAFVSNLDRFTFDGLRGPKPDLEPSFSYFTLHWGLPKKHPELDHHNLVIPASFEQGFGELYGLNAFPTQPIVYVNSTGPQDPEAAPAGSSNVFAVVTSPAKTDAIDWEARAPEYRRRVLDGLSRAGIDIEPETAVFERVQTPAYFESNHGNFRGSLYGPHERHRLWGMFPAPNRDSAWRNLAFCGGSVQPGAGLPMVALSGRFAVESLA